MTQQTYPNHIKQLRLMRGLTVKQLGEMSGVSPSTISKFERNLNQPRADACRRLAQALGVTEDAVRGADNPYIMAQWTKPKESGYYLCAYRTSVRYAYSYGVFHYDVRDDTWALPAAGEDWKPKTNVIRWWSEIPQAPEF